MSIARACLGLSVLALLAACPGSVPAPSLERGVERRIDRAVDAGFSGAVLIRSKGKQLVAKGFGLADRETQRRNTSATAFDVGSIVKLVTALAIYELEEAGALSVSDPIGALLPDVPSDKVAITLQQILLHRAGFLEYHDSRGDFEPMTRQEARARILAQPLLFDPGEDEAYSNSGYTLLADVIEAVSGEAYTDYVHRAVLDPADMDQSGFYAEPLWQSVPTAIGYEAERFEDNDPASWPYTWALMGNGGLVASVRDLDRLCDALHAGRILGAGALARFERDYLAKDVVTIDGEEVYAAAGGGDYGLGGVLIDVPSRRIRILLASNAYDAFDSEEFAQDLLEWLLTHEE